MSAQPFEIVRAIKRDIGTTPADLLSGARYCRNIANGARRNPWADCDMAPNYEAAAGLLETQAAEVAS